MQISGTDALTGKGVTLTVENGTITNIASCSDPEPGLLSAGLVDLQVNGYGGIDLNGGNLVPDQVSELCRKLLQTGVTRWLPTLITASEDSLLSAMSAISDACNLDPISAATIAGIHVEGPAISPVDGPRGAHPSAQVRAPDLAELDRWHEASGQRICMITLSPHWPDTPAYITAATKQGIHIAIGHTDATPDQIHAASQAGARLSTHLGNGAALSVPRHPNFIWAQLADEQLTTTLIADGHHLPADTLKVFLRAKGLTNCILVSDSVALGGMAPGFYNQPIGGDVEVTESGRLGIVGTAFLAGAWRNLNEDLVTASRTTDLALSDLLPLATSVPGRFVGGGCLAIGTPADIFRFTPAATRLKTVQVWLRGEPQLAG